MQEKQSYIVKAEGEVGCKLMLRCPRQLLGGSVQDISCPALITLLHLQAASAKLIGEAIQANPAFLTLRKIEVSVG